MKILRRIKWWFERANGQLPPCDCWDYKYTLANNLEQGLSFLLDDGNTDWEHSHMTKQKRELQFILDWAKAFPYYDTAICVKDEKEKAELEKTWEQNERIVITSKEADEWQKRTEKAFKYLAKNIHGLWD